MSKAFTKENDDAPEEALPDEPWLLPEGSPNYMTSEGAEALRRELTQLLLAPKAAHRERRIRFLKRNLDLLQEVDPTIQPHDSVRFGARVTLSTDDGQIKSYQIVGFNEADPKDQKISWISPVAKALLNKKIGDVVSLKSPRGEEDFEIIKIEWKFESQA